MHPVVGGFSPHVASVAFLRRHLLFLLVARLTSAYHFVFLTPLLSSCSTLTRLCPPDWGCDRDDLLPCRCHGCPDSNSMMAAFNLMGSLGTYSMIATMLLAVLVSDRDALTAYLISDW